MNIRKLKKFDFVLYFDSISADSYEYFDGYIVHRKGKKPELFCECERDNGLYSDTWIEGFGSISWKCIISNFKNKRLY